jgi:hypothetical protein
MKKNQAKLKKAVKTLRKALKKDPALFYAFQANIAMQFKDNYCMRRKEKGYLYMNNEDIHQIANESAKSFLNLLTSNGKKTRDN